MKKYIYIIRHGITDWNLQKKIQGPVDIPLNEKGKLQAETLSKKLKEKNIKLLFCSHLFRAYETAKIISNNLNIPVIINPLLREICHGDWNGKSYKELKLTYPKEHKIWKTAPHLIAPPNGETLGKVKERLLYFIKNNKIKSIDCPFGIVTHKIVGAVLCTILKNESLEKTPYYYQDNGNFIELSF